MAHGSKRSRSKSRRPQSFGFGTGSRRKSQPFLLTATDVCLWLTFFGVTVCFGGRAAVGQLILVVGAALTAGCWLLHQLTSRKPRRMWTGSEWLWLAGVVLGVSQIIPLPRAWMLAVSPKMAQILPPASASHAAGLGIDVWNQLSLAPWESASGLVTFISYALLFLVVAQRVQTMADVERTMYGVAIVAVAMAVFAQAQYFTTNGKFYWFYLHPYVTTDLRPTGCFTNRNHLAQFLALGIGPLIWCVLRRLEPTEWERADTEDGDQGTGGGGYETRLPANWNLGVTLAVSIGLGGTVLTALSTLSRGGLLATSVAVAVSIGTLWRLGLVSAKLCLGLVVVLTVIGGVFNLTGNEATLAARLEAESGREQVWRANIAVAQDFPIVGTGVGTHADAHQLHLDQPVDGQEFTHAECGYLQVLSETGYVGLGLALAFILVSLWWCWGALRNADTRVSSIAAAVLASLLANVTHAVGDFFWYTPSCMLLLAIQLACVCRLYRMTREGSGGGDRESEVRSRESEVSGGTGRVRRLVSLTALGGVLAAAAWMVCLKLPAALAEPVRMRYITLSLRNREFYGDDEEYQEAQHEKQQAAIRAARLDPHDSHLQEQAALAYVEWFNERQEHSENPMPLGQLQDVIRASQFESREAMQEWLDRAIGKNVKLLRSATKSLRQALRESPLRAYAYVQLAELAFLDAADEATESAYLKQACALRPHDSEILFARGKNVLLHGDLDGAMPYWREAFQRSPRVRVMMTNLLVGQVTSEFFLSKLKLEWSALPVVARAFDQVGRSEEAQPVWQKCIEEGMAHLKSELTPFERQQAIMAIHDAYTALEDPDRAIAVLSRAQRQMPENMEIRSRLAWDLYSAGRYSEAVEHLQWCAARKPNDKVYQQAAAKATKERLRNANVAPKDNPS